MQLLQARDAIARQLREDGFTTGVQVIGDHEALVARCSELLSTVRTHTFVVIFALAGLSGTETQRLADAAQQYAISHKGGLPRGLQTGTATLIVFLVEDVSDDAVAWVDRSPVHRFAALRFAMLVDVGRDEVVYWDGRWVRGWVFREHVLSTMRCQIIKPLNRLVEAGAALELRRAPGTEDEKLADALSAHRVATRRWYTISAAVLAVAAAVVLFLAGGIWPAIVGALLTIAAVGGMARLSLGRAGVPAGNERAENP